MNQEKQASEPVRWGSLILALAVAPILVLGSSLPPSVAEAQASETEVSTADVTTQQEARAPSVTLSARQRRKALLNAGRQARREERRQAAAQSQGVAAPATTSLPAAPPADLKVSLKVDPRLTRSLYMGDRWVSASTYVGTNGQDTVEARVTGVDAKGVAMRVSPRWIPADPEMVTVTPGQGDAVLITVRSAGESILRVVIENDSKAVIVAKELSITARYQGAAINVKIDTSGAVMKGSSAQQEPQGRPVVRSGWSYVDGGPAPRAQNRPVVRNGWKYVD